MNKKRLLGLILFANVIIAGLFLTTQLLIGWSDRTDAVHTREEQEITKDKSRTNEEQGEDIISEEIGQGQKDQAITIEEAAAGFATNTLMNDTLATESVTPSAPELIYDCYSTDYLSFIPEMEYDEVLKDALDINNPDISVDAEAAILFDAVTKKVLYYKKPVEAAFPASTLKLLTSIVALNWCSEDEEVTIGDEITMIASDSTLAYLQQGEILTIKSLLEGMLLPSGNDAAYAVAAYVGRKSLGDPKATKEAAVGEFVRLMNEKAKELGVKNSCFKTPDGYDAIGQYTTAYDMGLIGMEAVRYPTIVDIAGQSSARAVFVSGEDITWKNTNKLIKRYSGKYYSKAIGLKTGTSTMAGRCLIAAGKSEDREVVCVVLDSTSSGRWEDAIKLLKHGLE